MKISIYTFLLFILQYIFICRTDVVKLNSVALSYDNGSLFNILVDKFNKYSKENHLDIELSIIIYTISNSSLNVIDYGNDLEHLLERGSEKYDIFFYDVMYSTRYSPYFVDLRKWLPQNHIDLYSSGLASQTCKYNDKWVGLPIIVNFSVIYCNMELLKKYNMNIPKSWNELFEIGKKIKEYENDNNELIIYNGLFPEYETAICSIQEFIYSYRDKKESPFPNYTSHQAVNALNMIKRLKNELSSDEIFKNYLISVTKLFDGKSLFLKFWFSNIYNPVYKRIPLVGNKEGVSGSTIGGNNIAINKYITDIKKKKAAEVVKFITSKEIQKELLIENGLPSAINSLYEDKEVCQKIDCELMQNLQLIPRPNPKFYNYDVYSAKFRNIFSKFLYENESAINSLNQINDLTKIYQISIDPHSSSSVGLVVFLIVIIIIIWMVSAIPFLFMRKYGAYFRFLSIDFWIIMIVGLIFIIGTVLPSYGKVTTFKCQLKFFLLSFGYTFYIVPILHKLICNFPEENKIIQWCKKNDYLFFVFFILLEIVINGLFIISPHVPKIRNSEGKLFETCYSKNTLGTVLWSVLILEKIVELIAIAFLLFVEWNMWETHNDIRIITTAIAIDFFFLILSFISNSVFINHYVGYFILSSVIPILFTLSNFYLIYASKFIKIFSSNNSSILTIEMTYKNRTNNIESGSNYNNNTETSENSRTPSRDTNPQKKFKSKILNYHYSSSSEFPMKNSSRTFDTEMINNNKY